MKRGIIIATLVTAGGCEQVKRLDDGPADSGDAIPTEVAQRLAQSCAIPGCHVAGGVAPDLSPSSGGAWLNQSGAGGPYLTIGDLENSYLIEKLFPGPSSGSQMPLPPGVLSAEDLAVIVGWASGVQFPEGEAGDATGDAPAGDGTDETGDESGAASVSYSADVRPLFAARGCLACHHDNAAVGVDIVDPFTAPDGLVGSINTWAEAYPEGGTPTLNVSPGDPDESFLIDKLTDPYTVDPAIGGAAMPLNLEPLTAQERADLRSWIDAGAQNDAVFEEVIRPIFGDETRLGARGGKCTYCHHSFGGQPPNLTDPFDPETGAVGVSSIFNADAMIIEPGNADASVLVQKVEATEPGPLGGPMPPSYPPLSSAELETVRAWIAAGAPDN